MSEIIRVEIEKLIAGGDGLCYIDQKACFVEGAIPKEVLDIKITEDCKSYYRAKIVNIVKASEFRIEPVCKYYKECGGCNFQHINYKGELLYKKDIVKDIFSRNGKIELDIFKIESTMDFGYRNRVQFHKSKNHIGFKGKESNNIIDIDNCPVLVKSLNDFLENPTKVVKDRFTVFGNDNDFFVGDETSTASVNIKGKNICFNPSGFFQSNLSLLPQLIDCVNNFITGSTVMDLYCGVGLFSSFFPLSVEKIIAVEMDKRVKPFVDSNLNGLNYDFYPLSLEDFVTKKSKNYKTIDSVVVDPPRKGLSPKVRKYLLTLKCPRIIYVSCDPTTMARDISDLTKNGYKLSHFQLFDFYPNTSHMESLGVLDLA